MTFDAFWKLYPRRVAKLAAQKAWAKLTAKECEAALEALPAHIDSWAGRDMDKVPHPASWLNGQRWTDELHTEKRQPVMSDHEYFRIHGHSRRLYEDVG